MTAPNRLARLAHLMPGGTSQAARTPFVLLIVVLLGSGLLALLLLNASVNQGSFELSELKQQTKEHTDEQQALQQEVDAYSAPDALDRRARELGLVPGGSPVFLMPDGSVRGVPEPATPDPGR
ncbi:septum formation initiator family protein [Streptomyces sparsus]